MLGDHQLELVYVLHNDLHQIKQSRHCFRFKCFNLTSKIPFRSLPFPSEKTKYRFKKNWLVHLYFLNKNWLGRKKVPQYIQFKLKLHMPHIVMYAKDDLRDLRRLMHRSTCPYETLQFVVKVLKTGKIIADH